MRTVGRVGVAAVVLVAALSATTGCNNQGQDSRPRERTSCDQDEGSQECLVQLVESFQCHTGGRGRGETHVIVNSPGFFGGSHYKHVTFEKSRNMNLNPIRWCAR